MDGWCNYEQVIHLYITKAATFVTDVLHLIVFQTTSILLVNKEQFSFMNI